MLLATGVLVASTSAILSRLAFPPALDPLDVGAWRGSGGVHPLALSLWRCAIAAAVLWPLCRRRLRRAAAPGGASVSSPGETWLGSAGNALALLGGATAAGYALAGEDIGATTVSVAMMAESVIATALAFVLLHEVPPAVVYPGGGLILVGISLVSTAPRSLPVVVD